MEQSEADWQPGCCGGLPCTRPPAWVSWEWDFWSKMWWNIILDISVRGFFFWREDEINIELYGLGVKQIALCHVGGLHPISWRLTSRTKDWPLLNKREFCSTCSPGPPACHTGLQNLGLASLHNHASQLLTIDLFLNICTSYSSASWRTLSITPCREEGPWASCRPLGRPHSLRGKAHRAPRPGGCFHRGTTGAGGWPWAHFPFPLKWGSSVQETKQLLQGRGVGNEGPVFHDLWLRTRPTFLIYK